jgi:hypothetical protein
MSALDVTDFHWNLAKHMIAEIQSWKGSEDVRGLERLASTASEPVMLACFLAAIAAEGRDLGTTGVTA